MQKRQAIFSNSITAAAIMGELRNTFGHTSFRGNVQAEAVRTLTRSYKNDAFVCLPTGGGKSLIYQLPVWIL